MSSNNFNKINNVFYYKNNGARIYQKNKLLNNRKKFDINEPNYIKKNNFTSFNSLNIKKTFNVFASCNIGNELVLKKELEKIYKNFSNIFIEIGGCSLLSDWTGIQLANLYSRIATKIFIKIKTAEINKENDIRELAYHTKWEDWFEHTNSIRIDTTGHASIIKNLEYCNLLVKDGLCDRLRKIKGVRPDVDKKNPKIRIFLFLNKNIATLYIDSSGEPLFKRGWRFAKIDAPIKENLASGFLAMSYSNQNIILDPFCGSGTIAIEAAQSLLNIPPGILRSFGFENLIYHDNYNWKIIKEEAYSNILQKTDKIIFASDINPKAIDICNENAERALVKKNIKFICQDANQINNKYLCSNGLLITNIPYGYRMHIDKYENINDKIWLKNWSTKLKNQFPLWKLSILSDDNYLPKYLGMIPNEKIQVYNGKISCNIFIFKIFNNNR
ncbi:Ribosomal RNA large subunit methyltransferase L [Candidatus Kinetoplastibacterium sorsogonicusi]|uniref:Ribosomal RNA large subunit methyltransferase L n=1 Tax=Candidatus Kinetoplastidibacterium kentomonadis TaxID=1576550 RepID=A0A3S7JA40_9PROT|nr:THUMP domain-containing protein [Candidatus Kinetoplastibacterium sorsogonicusi]AWD32542.1 Ribosomal RNA large subunit methyltransferase L [Candidatus Kinetoplastibacterium sorsogonicusi]